MDHFCMSFVYHKSCFQYATIQSIKFFYNVEVFFNITYFYYAKSFLIQHLGLLINSFVVMFADYADQVFYTCTEITYPTTLAFFDTVNDDTAVDEVVSDLGNTSGFDLIGEFGTGPSDDDSDKVRDNPETDKNEANYSWYRYITHFDIYAPIFGGIIVSIIVIVCMLRQSLPTSTMFNLKNATKNSERPETQKLKNINFKGNRLFVFLKKMYNSLFKK